MLCAMNANPVASDKLIPCLVTSAMSIPRELRVTGERSSGADAFKLHRQIARFGASSAGMPPIVVYEATDGVLVIYNGVTRATRIAKLAPGTLVHVEVAG